MAQVKKYHLPPTRLIPNSPHPVLHYQGLLSEPRVREPQQIRSALDANGWEAQWIFRYGATQQSHYHSRVHEAMAVLSGTATIRFGAADTTTTNTNTNAVAHETEPGGVEVQAAPGDVFVVPAGVAHKTFNAAPRADFALLSPGDGRGIPDDGAAGDALADVRLSGFTMMGAYPKDGGAWDFAVGGVADAADFEAPWAVPRPARDPFLGASLDGIVGQWKETVPSEGKS
ncbi:hypothetical protein GGR52DRAFT_576022 [Hypoxylon sp. FL1284]|nr:hypothetical protein GGR52DRAFT_576022 [Hypoxylon sp. FL1284]